MTPEQEDALIAWAHEVTRGLVVGVEQKKLVRTHRDLCAVLGYTETHIVTGYPVKPKPVVVPGLGQAQRQAFVNRDLQEEALATSDPEGHQQAIADADYDAKHVAITDLLRQHHACNFTYSQKAIDIMRLWSELKAIMEPDR